MLNVSLLQVVLRGALSLAEVADINRALDELPKMKLGDWLGHAHMTAGPGDISLQQLYELGPAFERLIDHPAYFEKLRRFIGGNGWDNQHNGLLTIDEVAEMVSLCCALSPHLFRVQRDGGKPGSQQIIEEHRHMGHGQAFANFRATGGGIPMHGSGGADGNKTTPGSMKAQYRFANDTFLSGQINMALALSDIGPGDGATMLLPGSHKANIARPAEMVCRSPNADTVFVNVLTLSLPPFPLERQPIWQGIAADLTVLAMA